MKLAPGRPAGVLLPLTLLLLPSIADAYLDPGTGSYVVQLLIGGLLGGLFALGVFWRRGFGDTILIPLRSTSRPNGNPRSWSMT